MTPSDLLRSSREGHGVSVRRLAEAAGVSASTVHRIEKGEMEPTVEMLKKLLETLGVDLQLQGRPDYAASVVGLADAIFEEIESGRDANVVRMTSEFVTRFRLADGDSQRRMIAVEPKMVLDDRWDAFIGALGQWLAVTAKLSVPPWTFAVDRYLPNAWWVSPKKTLHAWEYAGTPASFQDHGVYIHRESLVNV